MTDARLQSFSQDVEKLFQYLRTEFSKLQTGRANAALVEHVDVEAYGQHQELRTIAGVSIPDARTIAIQPWDKSIVQNVLKALQSVDLGSSPMSDGAVIRINLPPMTEERREQLKKVVQKLAEEARISVRQHRQQANDKIKEEKDEDVRKTLQDELQKATDEANRTIDEMKKKKEEEVMTI